MSITTVNFDPDKKRIEDIFEGSLQLVIPRYQRTYSWTKDKAEEFYSDFIEESEKAEDNLAFLGTILFSIGDNGSLEVIDGQQRLITITLFLAALRDVLSKTVKTTEAKLAADQIQRKIKISSTFGSSYSNSEPNKYKLQVGVEIEHIFNSLIYEECPDLRTIKPINSAEKKVFESYNLFYKNLNETLNRPGLGQPEQKLRLADRLLAKINSIEYIDIRVTNKEVAYNLFESHNAKGVALAKTDLIKNYYFGRLSGTDADKNKRMDEWDGLLNKLDENTSFMQPDRFFYYMLQSYEGNFPSSSLYRRIKPKIGDTHKFYKLLKQNITLMIELKNSNTSDKDINRSLSALNETLKVNQCFILLLSMHRNREKLSPSLYKKIVLLIEEFTYIYSGVAKFPANALEKIYSKHAAILEEDLSHFQTDISKPDKERATGRLLKYLREDLMAILPPFTTFSESFAALTYTNYSTRGMIRYSFAKMEYVYSRGIVELSDSFTLDHIISQKSSKANDETYQSIGNLVPMSKVENSSKGSNMATTEYYKNTDNFYAVKSLNEQLEKRPDFDEESIRNRSAYLAEYAYYSAFSTILKN